MRSAKDWIYPVDTEDDVEISPTICFNTQHPPFPNEHYQDPAFELHEEARYAAAHRAHNKEERKRAPWAAALRAQVCATQSKNSLQWRT